MKIAIKPGDFVRDKGNIRWKVLPRLPGNPYIHLKLIDNIEIKELKPWGIKSILPKELKHYTLEKE